MLRPLALGTRTEAAPQRTPALFQGRDRSPAPPCPVGCKAPPQPSRVPEKLPRPAAPSPPPARGFFQHQGEDSSRAVSEERRRGGRGPGRRAEGSRAQERKGEVGQEWGGKGRGGQTQAGGRGVEPGGGAHRSRTLLSRGQTETPGAGTPVAPGRGRRRKMPVRRGHVAPQNTYLDTIIRKFEGQSECVYVGAGGRSGVLVP